MALSTNAEFYALHPYAGRVMSAIDFLKLTCEENHVPWEEAREWANKHFNRTDLCLAAAYEEAAQRILFRIPLGAPGSEREFPTEHVE